MFQRPRDRSMEFYRGWTEYEHDFGDVNGEHWLGLKRISCLTGAKPVAQLRVDLADLKDATNMHLTSTSQWTVQVTTTK